VAAIQADADLPVGERQSAEVAARLESADRCLVEAQARSHPMWLRLHRGLPLETRLVCAMTWLEQGADAEPHSQAPQRPAAAFTGEPLHRSLTQSHVLMYVGQCAERVDVVTVHGHPPSRLVRCWCSAPLDYLHVPVARGAVSPSDTVRRKAGPISNSRLALPATRRARTQRALLRRDSRTSAGDGGGSVQPGVPCALTE
jgi:hypothetical protein